MQYSFSELLDDLEVGREIEFKYCGKQYGIVNGEGKWFFFADGKGEVLCQFEESDILLNCVKKLSIQGKPLADIINENTYDQNSLSIF